MDELKQQLIDYIEEHSDGFEDMPWCLSMRYKRSTLISCTTTKPNNQKKRDADKEMKKKKVKLVKLPRRNIDRLRLGMFGEILAYREGHVLVKWKGRTGPVSHKTSEVEVIVEKKQTL
jgi:hypothetical protein